MKQVCTDLSVYDFSQEDELAGTFTQLSKIRNPNNSITKTNQFSHYEVHSAEHIHVLAIGDLSHGFIDDASRGPLDLPSSAGSIQSAGLGETPETSFGHCEDSIQLESSSSDMETRDSSPFRSSPLNAYTNSTLQDSPYSDGSTDGRTPGGDDSIQESCIPSPASLLDENTGYAEAQETSVSSLEMEEGDAIVLHTDYVTFRNKYFPASPISISKISIKLEALALEEEVDACMLEWEIDNILRIETQWNSLANTAKVKFHLLTKDAMQAEKNHNASDFEVLEFLIHDPDWSHRQKIIFSLNLRLKTLWSAEMNSSCDGDAFSLEDRESSYPYIPNFEEPFEEVIYPKGDVDAVSISKRDFDLLQPETFINDTIIDFYMKYLKNGILPEERHRFHFFNSFFFRKLADLDKNPSSASDGRAAFQRVRKWTRKVNIFEKDYIFIPVNYNLHWSLLVICYPGAVSSFSDENVGESLRVPCILHMDSIRGSHRGLKDLLQSYLLEEWKERQMKTYEDISSKFSNLRFLSLELPQQENCSDCGLFLLHYAEFFIAEAPLDLNPFSINKFDCFLKPDWFVPAEASLKRAHIQRLIHELLESRFNGIALPFCNDEVLPSADGIGIISDKRSPGRSRKIEFFQPIQGIEFGLLDVPLCRSSQSIDDPSLGMTELLQQHQPYYDKGASLARLRCPMSPIREELEDDENIAHSTLDEQAKVDLCGELAWNMELSDHDEPNGESSPVSNSPSDDSKEMTILESDIERQDKGAGQKQTQNMEESKGNMDSTEDYASASNDTMELHQQHQPYDKDDSLARLRCPMSPIREELEDDENIAHSTLDEQAKLDFCGELAWNMELSDRDEPNGESSPVPNSQSDDFEEMTILKSDLEKQDKGAGQNQSRNLEESKEQEDDENIAHSTLDEQGKLDLCGEFAWSMELSDRDEPNGESSPMPNSQSDDVEEMTILKNDLEKQDNGAGQNQSQNLESKENMDSAEGYASASSDAMETQPEDSQEFDTEFGSNDQEDLPSNAEEAPHPYSQEFDRNDKIEGDTPCLVEKSVAEDSSPDSDEDRVLKKMRLTLTPPPDGEKQEGVLLTSMSSEALGARSDDSCTR